MSVLKLDYTPRKWQSICHRKRRRFTVLVLHRRAGKTRLALMELLNAALRCELDMGRFAYIAPQRNQAKTNVWKILKDIVRGLIATGHVVPNESELELTFVHNGATLRLYGADNADAIRGSYFDGVVLDEVAQMKVMVWDSVVRPMLGDRRGWAIFIGTVEGVDLFSERYFHALEKMKQGHPDYYVGLWDVYQTNALDPDEVQDMHDEMSPQAWAREMLCDFSAKGDAQVISLHDVMLATKRVYTPGDIYHSPRVIGVDPARFGNDRSTIIKRQGLQMHKPIVLRGVDNMDLAARVAYEINEWRPDAVFVDAGHGAGVIDRLRQMGHKVVEVPFGGNALKDDTYVNRRTEMWWLMRDWIVGGGALPDELSLRQELATPTYSFDARGRIKLESKDDIKKRMPANVGSPDIADGLALTFAAPVRSKAMMPDSVWPVPGVPAPQHLHRKGKKKGEWNPYSKENRRR